LRHIYDKLCDRDYLSEETIADSAEPKSIAELKSDAKPLEYLAELKAYEDSIASDLASVNRKDYELSPLPELEIPERHVRENRRGNADPLLLAKIERDRQIVEEHKAQSMERERQLNERIKRDREMMGLDSDLNEEIREAELKALDREPPMTGTEKLGTRGEESSAVTDMVEAENSSVVMDSISPPLEIVAVDGSQSSESDSLAEQPIRSDSITVGSTVSEVVDIPAQNREAQSDIKVEHSGEVGAEDPTAFPESEVVVESVDSLESIVSNESPSGQRKSESVAVRADNESDASRFLHAVALRSYASRAVDFGAIEDPAKRSMIQRMAAEDRGRMAVLKQHDNASIVHPENAESLAKLPRTAEVLSRQPVKKTEVVPTTFDPTELRQRKDVSFRAMVALGDFVLSETVMEALDPIYAQQVLLPEFDIVTDHVLTPLEAKRVASRLRESGLSNFTIVPFLRNVPVTMSAIQNLPLVD